MFTDYFHPHIGGGVERFTLEVSKRLVKKGYDVTVITFNTKKVEPYEKYHGIRIYRCSAISLTNLIGSQLTVSLDALPQMFTIIKKEKPDILHAHNRFFISTIYAVLMKYVFNLPLITMLHATTRPHLQNNILLNLGTRFYEKSFSKLIVKNSDLVLALNKAGLHQALQLGGTLKKIAIIPTGVDHNHFQPTYLKHHSSAKKKVVYVGRLINIKGLHLLIRAAPIILAKRPLTEFILVGDGPLKDGLRSLAKQLHVAHAFHFLGLRTDVNDILKECDIFVLPSLTEAMPLTVLEAMASGLPVIATKVGGNVELLQHSGILIDCDSTALANAVLMLLENPLLATELSQRSLLKVTQQYSWEKTTDMLSSVYNELLASKI
jgi:glycosyltransferase involved in cell wall biosynthesis